MTQHLHRGIEKLKGQLLALGALVEKSLHDALVAFDAKDAFAAKRIIAADEQVDLLEVEIEEDCLKLLALHQPVAADLRFIVSVLKINSDLERIGDFAVTISWSAVEREKLTGESSFSLSVMTDQAQAMVREVLRAVVEVDCSRARSVLKMDDIVDAENRRIHREVMDESKRRPDNAETHACVLAVARSLERVADHATNIAEDVIYMVEGDIVRHGRLLKH
jgi:phosphate transport system protein